MTRLSTGSVTYRPIGLLLDPANEDLEHCAMTVRLQLRSSPELSLWCCSVRLLTRHGAGDSDGPSPTSPRPTSAHLMTHRLPVRCWLANWLRHLCEACC